MGTFLYTTDIFKIAYDEATYSKQFLSLLIQINLLKPKFQENQYRSKRLPWSKTCVFQRNISISLLVSLISNGFREVII